MALNNPPEGLKVISVGVVLSSLNKTLEDSKPTAVAVVTRPAVPGLLGNK